jgi:hypothetical protein
VEYTTADHGERARYSLQLALARAKVALKDSIEQGKPGTGASTGIQRDSTKINVESEIE